MVASGKDGKDDFYTRLGGARAEEDSFGPRMNPISIDAIYPNPDQPRRKFSDESLEELAESIKERGVLEPIIVRKRDGGGFTIVCGERRWRAAKLANLETIKAIVKQYDGESGDRDMRLDQLTENLQREDLLPTERAYGICEYIRLSLGLDGQEDVKNIINSYRVRPDVIDSDTKTKLDSAISRIGKSASTIRRMLMLLNLSEHAKECVDDPNSGFSQAHAELVSVLLDDAIVDSVVNKVVTDKLSVKETEALVRRMTKKDADNENTVLPIDGKKPFSVIKTLSKTAKMFEKFPDDLHGSDFKRMKLRDRDNLANRIELAITRMTAALTILRTRSPETDRDLSANTK